jgi:Fe2+ or Zn2+ uptake regulation protein
MSKQKQLIYELVASTMTHPTADWVYQHARKSMPHISLGTVYRNLKSLTEEGRILEITTIKGPSRYDANTSKHSHLRCVDCGHLEDVPEKEIVLSSKTKRLRNFKIFEYKIELLGLCPGCQKKSTNGAGSRFLQ